MAAFWPKSSGLKCCPIGRTSSVVPSSKACQFVLFLNSTFIKVEEGCSKFYFCPWIQISTAKSTQLRPLLIFDPELKKRGFRCLPKQKPWISVVLLSSYNSQWLTHLEPIYVTSYLVAQLWVENVWSHASSRFKPSSLVQK